MQFLKFGYRYRQALFQMVVFIRMGLKFTGFTIIHYEQYTKHRHKHQFHSHNKISLKQILTTLLISGQFIASQVTGYPPMDQPNTVMSQRGNPSLWVQNCITASAAFCSWSGYGEPWEKSRREKFGLKNVPCDPKETKNIGSLHTNKNS